MSGTRAYDRLRDSWASAQSENMRLLVRELLRIFKPQQACALLSIGTMKPALLVENAFLQNGTDSQPVSSRKNPFGSPGTGMNLVAPQTQGSCPPRSVDLRLPLVVIKRSLPLKVARLFPHSKPVN